MTRSGSNDCHGSGYFFYRDHNMAAYPNLQRIASDPSPFFVRRNPGASIGGPIKKDKLFFFFNYEYHEPGRRRWPSQTNAIPRLWRSQEPTAAPT